MTVRIIKFGKKWAVVDPVDGAVMFTGRTRVSCFRFAYENGLDIEWYQHGGE